MTWLHCAFALVAADDVGISVFGNPVTCRHELLKGDRDYEGKLLASGNICSRTPNCKLYKASGFHKFPNPIVNIT